VLKFTAVNFGWDLRICYVTPLEGEVTSYLGFSRIDDEMHGCQRTANHENELATNLILEAGLNLQL
jgi:hypothetical protein